MAEMGESRPVVEPLPYGAASEELPRLVRRHSDTSSDLPQAADSAETYNRYQALVQRAVSVFGDKITASRWLSTPSADFGGQVPLQIAMEEGYSLDRFEPLFVRIEHGVDF